MYPYLKNKLGKTKGRIAGGILWGVWHWPLILLGGHFFGNEYWGAPVLGPIAVCVSLTAFGILIDHIYEKTDSILMACRCRSSDTHYGIRSESVRIWTYCIRIDKCYSGDNSGSDHFPDPAVI